MAAKKSARKPATLDTLAALIFRTAASSGKKVTVLAGDISGVKDNIAGVKGEIADLKPEMMARFDHIDTRFGAIDDRLRNRRYPPPEPLDIGEARRNVLIEMGHAAPLAWITSAGSTIILAQSHALSTEVQSVRSAVRKH